MKITIKNDKNESLDAVPAKRSVSSKKHTVNPEFSHPKKNTLLYLLYFFVIVGVFIIIALIARFFFTIKNSTFITPSYSVLVESQSPFLVIVDRESKSLSLVDLPNTFSSKMANSFLYKIPIDGKIMAKKSGINSSSFPKTSFLLTTLLRPWEYKYEGMTSLDAVKITQFALAIPKKDIERFSITVTKDGEVEGITQEALYDMFKDPRIINDQQSIEVVNATSQEGLAGGAAQIIKNAGGNVVSVASSNNTKHSKLIAAQKSPTLSRLTHILGLEPIVDKEFSSISDIQIILGEDFVSKVK